MLPLRVANGEPHAVSRRVADGTVRRDRNFCLGQAREHAADVVRVAEVQDEFAQSRRSFRRRRRADARPRVERHVMVIAPEATNEAFAP